MSDEVVETPFGKFLVDPEDCIGGTLKAGTLWDGPGFLQPLAIEYGDLGTPGVTILDVGANFGQFSVWLAAHGAWRVIAVEPMPEMVRYCKANFDLNREICADHVVLIPMAAYDKPCEVISQDFSRRNMGGASVVPLDGTEGVVGRMPAVPLDRYAWLFGKRVSLIKVDAQGCDAAALHGLEQTIRRDHPAIVFEWEDRLAPPHGYTLNQTDRWLQELGYHAIQEWASHPHNYLATWSGR